MKLADRHNAAMMAFLALGARVVFTLILDGPHLLNASWFAALCACVLTVPLALCLDYIERVKNVSGNEIMRAGRVGRVYCVVLAAFMLYDAASGIQLLSDAAAYISLETSVTPMLSTFCAAAAAVACACGVQAVAGAASVGVRLFLITLAIIVFSQINSYNMRWLTPVLGAGIPALAEATVSMGGIMTGLVAVWLLIEQKKESHRHLYMLKVLTLVALFVTALLMLYSMLMPSMPSGSITRQFQLERLFDNGRVHQAIPILIVPMWYGLMMMAIAFSTLGGVHTLALTFPSIKPLWLNLLFSAAALALALADVGSRALLQLVNAIRLPVCTLPIFVYALVCALKRKRRVST